MMAAPKPAPKKGNPFRVGMIKTSYFAERKDDEQD